MFEQLSRSSGNVLGFKISDRSSDEDMRQARKIMEDAVAAAGKVRLLIEIEGFRHMEAEALMEKLKFVMDHAGDIERIAVVGSRVWIKSWVKVSGLLARTETEYFDRSEIEVAWRWISE